jgi:beta-galactosidase
MAGRLRHQRGHLVLGPRTGYGDALGRARRDVAPGKLADIAGAWYDEFSNLDDPVRVVPRIGLSSPAAADLVGTRWLDGINADTADILASYEHPHFGRFAAITTRAHGAGRVTCVRTLPSPELGRSLFEWAQPGSNVWDQKPESVTATSGKNHRGEELRFLHNWSWQPAVVRSSLALTDPIKDQRYEAGEPIELASWDCTLLMHAG